MSCRRCQTAPFGLSLCRHCLRMQLIFSLTDCDPDADAAVLPSSGGGATCLPALTRQSLSPVVVQSQLSADSSTRRRCPDCSDKNVLDDAAAVTSDSPVVGLRHGLVLSSNGSSGECRLCISSFRRAVGDGCGSIIAGYRGGGSGKLLARRCSERRRHDNVDEEVRDILGQSCGFSDGSPTWQRANSAADDHDDENCVAWRPNSQHRPDVSSGGNGSSSSSAHLDRSDSIQRPSLNLYKMRVSSAKCLFRIETLHRRSNTSQCHRHCHAAVMQIAGIEC